MRKKNLVALLLGAITIASTLIVGMLTSSMANPSLIWILVAEVFSTLVFTLVLSGGNFYMKANMLSAVTLYAITSVGYSLVFQFLSLDNLTYLHVIQVIIHTLTLIILIIMMTQSKKEISRY